MQTIDLVGILSRLPQIALKDWGLHPDIVRALDWQRTLDYTLKEYIADSETELLDTLYNNIMEGKGEAFYLYPTFPFTRINYSNQ